jgi:hypothetical protein
MARQTPKPKKQLSHRRKIIRFIVLPILAMSVLLFGLTSWLRINSLQNQISDLYMNNFATAPNPSQRDFVVDPVAKKAYIPELNLVMPYDPEVVGQLSYYVGDYSSSAKENDVLIYDKYQLLQSKATSHGSELSGCRQPIHIVIGDSSAEGQLVYKHAIHDGRSVALYVPIEQECAGYMDGSTAKSVVSMLRQLDSY